MSLFSLPSHVPAFHVTGSGPPLLIVPDMTVDHRYAALQPALLSALERQYTCITFTPNCGTAETYDDIAEQGHAVIRKAGFESANVVGIGTGATAALAFAGHFRSSTRSVIAINGEPTNPSFAIGGAAALRERDKLYNTWHKPGESMSERQRNWQRLRSVVIFPGVSNARAISAPALLIQLAPLDGRAALANSILSSVMRNAQVQQLHTPSVANVGSASQKIVTSMLDFLRAHDHNEPARKHLGLTRGAMSRQHRWELRHWYRERHLGQGKDCPVPHIGTTGAVAKEPTELL